MKKLFIVLAVASLGFVACNNESDTAADKTADSLAKVRTADSLAAVQKAYDDSVAAANAKDTSNKTGADTSKKAN